LCTGEAFGNHCDVDRWQQNMGLTGEVVEARPPEPSLEALPTRWSRSWAVIVLLSTIAVAAASLVGAPELVRAPIVVWFLAICPGMAVIRLFRLDEPVAEVMLACALSLALAGLIPAVFLYLDLWSPAWSLTLLVAIASAALMLDPVLVPRDAWRTAGGALRGRILILLGHVDPSSGGVRPLLPPRPSRRSSQHGYVPPPPIAVVTRYPTKASPVTVYQRRRAGSSLGPDPLVDDQPSVALRTTFDRVIGEIADRRRRDD
jgi:hypothetical protein